MSTLRYLIAILTFCSSHALAADWLFLDLGEVVVSGDPTVGYTYVQGAKEFLAEQRAAGRQIALLSNIPESWGVTCKAKFSKLKAFLGSRLHEPEAFDWRMFDLVILPPFDRYRKPKAFLFLSALAQACPHRAAYVGESLEEIATAKNHGFGVFHKGADVSLPAPRVMDAVFDTFGFEHPEDCDFTSAMSRVTEPQDLMSNVRACAVIPD